MTFDTIIIGGGPAGLAAAARLGRTGRRVLLAEKRGLPQKKCCGEFLHPSAVHEIRALLGKNPEGTAIRRVVISSGKTVREFPLPQIAISLRRETLSELLLSSALSSGAKIITGCGAEISEISDDRIEIQAGTDRHSAKEVVIAEGPASPTARRLGLVRAATRVVYGFSTRIPTERSNMVALAAVRGGYIGLCDLGGGTLNLAGLLSARAYHRIAPHKSRFGGRLLSEIPAWEGMVHPAAQGFLYQAPAVSGGIDFENRWPNGIFIIGDAAGMRETAFGDGIARALRQAGSVSAALEKYPDRPGLAAQHYLHALKVDAHRANRFALKTAGRILRMPALTNGLLRLAAPWVRSFAARAARAAYAIPSPLKTTPAVALPRTT